MILCYKTKLFSQPKHLILTICRRLEHLFQIVGRCVCDENLTECGVIQNNFQNRADPCGVEFVKNVVEEQDRLFADAVEKRKLRKFQGGEECLLLPLRTAIFQ